MRGAGTMKGKRSRNAARPVTATETFLRGRDARWMKYGALAASAILMLGLMAFAAAFFLKWFLVALAFVVMSAASAAYVYGISIDVDFMGDMRD